jgi:hypothetical protein
MKKILILVSLIFTTWLAAPAQEKTSVDVLGDKKPISIGIVVDNSGSFRLGLDFVINTAKVFINDLGSADEAFLVRFISKDKIDTIEDMTSDKTSLSLSADQMYCEGGLTAIPEALLYSTKYLSENGKNERKILILITDGDSNSDKAVYADAISFLKDKKIPVYIVGITFLLDRNIRESQRSLEKIAGETGGSVVFVNKQISAKEAANELIKAFRPQEK